MNLIRKILEVNNALFTKCILIQQPDHSPEHNHRIRSLVINQSINQIYFPNATQRHTE